MFKLRELPFDSNLNSVVSSETCSFHYGKHHNAYVNNLNNLIKDTEFEDKSLLQIILNSKGGIFNNAAQVYNHDFYWDCIAKKSEMSSKLKDAIELNFKDFKDEFLKAAAGQFGSGWCWLVYDLKSTKLEIVATSNANNPLTENKIPLLVVDVWEHAYYLDFKNARPIYLEKFYENINWEFVSKQYELAVKDGINSVENYVNELHKTCCCCCH